MVLIKTPSRNRIQKTPPLQARKFTKAGTYFFSTILVETSVLLCSFFVCVSKSFAAMAAVSHLQSTCKESPRTFISSVACLNCFLTGVNCFSSGQGTCTAYVTAAGAALRIVSRTVTVRSMNVVSCTTFSRADRSKLHPAVENMVEQVTTITKHKTIFLNACIFFFCVKAWTLLDVLEPINDTIVILVRREVAMPLYDGFFKL